MRKFLSVGFATIAALLLLFVVLFTAMEVTINDQTFIENEFTKLDITHAMGISNSDLVKSTMRLIDYMQGKAPDIDVEVTLNNTGETVQMFELEQERTHMTDVQQIYLTIKGYRDYAVLGMLVLFLLAAVINFKKAPQTLGQGYLSGSFIALLLFGFLGTWAASDFTSFWTFFHETLFWNDLWLFDATESRMINMLPEQMFSDIVGRIFLYAGVVMGLLIAAAILVLVFTSKSYLKKRAENRKHDKERKAARLAAKKAREEMKAQKARERAKEKKRKEKEKRKAEAQKKRGKADGAEKPSGKKRRGKAEATGQTAADAAAAGEQPALDDDAPAAYTEDEEGYPVQSDAPDGLPDNEEVASIDEILSARRPQATAESALDMPPEEPEDGEPYAEEAPDAPQTPAVKTDVASIDDILNARRRPRYDAYGDAETRAPYDDAPYDDMPYRDAAETEAYFSEEAELESDGERMEPDRKKSVSAHKKTGAKKGAGLLGALKKAAKADSVKSAPQAKPKAKKKTRSNIDDDTGFFDE